MTPVRTAFFVSASEASSLLNVSTAHLYRLARQGKIPCYRLSPRTLRFDPDELRAFMRLKLEGEREGRAEQ